MSFKLLAGTSAAIIGPSGAGKTTLLNLLPRFFDPVSGAVLLEGVDLRDLRLEDLRAQIALVLQEPIILPTTVAEVQAVLKICRDMGAPVVARGAAIAGLGCWVCRPPVIVGHSGDGHPNGRLSDRYAGICPPLFPLSS